MCGWSGRRDQVGGWGQRRVGGDEEAESRQQEVGRDGVDEGEAREAESRQQEAGHAERRGRGQSERKRKKRKTEGPL